MSIEFTALGALLIPLAILLLFRPAWLPAGLVFMSIFQAGAVLLVTRGGSYFGLAPQFFLLLMAIPVLAVMLRVGGPLEKPAWHVASPILLLAVYGALSALVLPHLFIDQVMVYPPRLGLGISHAVLLQPSSSNGAQAFYLCILCLAFWLVVRLVARMSIHAISSQIVWALIGAGCLVTLIGLYQVTAVSTGMWYPSTFFNSNLAYAQLYNQHLANLTRLSATFTEPSEAAAFLSGAFAAGLYLLITGVRRWLTVSVTAILLLALALTTSTTAYVTTVLVTLVILAKTIGSRRLSPRIILSTVVIALLLVGVVAGYAVTHPAEAARLWTGVVARKAETMSFRDRADSNWNALSLPFKTWGLGAGLGSTRASSLIATFFGNLGVLGLLLPLLWYGRFRKGWKSALAAVRPLTRKYLTALGWGMVALFLAGAMAVPDFEQVPLWIGLAVISGVTVRVRCDRERVILAERRAA